MNEVIAFLARDFFIVVLVLAAGFVLFKYRKDRLELLISGTVIGGLALLIAKAASKVIVNPRPFLSGGPPPLIASATDNGFPSDHTLALAAVAAVILIKDWKAGLVFWLFALVVGLSRVLAGVHHLLDIAGSALIVLIAAGLYLLGRRFWLLRASSSKH